MKSLFIYLTIIGFLFFISCGEMPTHDGKRRVSPPGGYLKNVPSEYSSIQAALNASNIGDTVLVQSGTYYENITWPIINRITLLSVEGATNTIIDGGENGSVITISGDYYNYDSAYVEGFTIRNGYGWEGPSQRWVFEFLQ